MNYVEKLVAKQQKKYHNEIYVDYRKQSIITKLKRKELEDRLEWLTESGYQLIKHTTLRAKIPAKSYSLCYNDHIIKLTYFDGKKHYWCTTNYHDDTKNLDTPNSFKMFKLMFKKRTGVNLLKAFGRTTQAYKKHCPLPLYYISPYFEKCKWYQNICKEDYSSHYPNAATQLLPDANTAKVIEAYVKPDKEYQFAFYPDTGHVAVFNEFDSHDWITEVKMFSANPKNTTNFPRTYTGKDKKTILMKASNYDLKDEIMHFYNIKANSPKDSADYNDSKIFLLKFIGMLEQVNPVIYASYPYAHLAAVIKWRANIKTFQTIRTIGYNKIIQICVDGFIHSGDPIGTKDVYLGSLNTEVTGARFVQRGINQYILENKEQHYKEVKHVGLDVNTSSYNVMTWLASPKINFIEYIKKYYEIEDLNNG